MKTANIYCKKSNSIMSLLKDIVKNRALYIMFLPAMLLLLLFNYLPLSGLVLAFKDVSFTEGIWGSDWTKPFYNNFIFLFSSDSAIRAFRNTILLNSLFIVFGVFFEVGLALLLNEINNKHFKRITQSITILPYFVSWIVVGVFAYNFFSTDNGAVNGVLSRLGIPKVEWYCKPEVWPFILVVINRWKASGYGSIIYLATLAGIDSSYYEAAQIDGATKWHQIKYITIPLLRPTIIIMTLLQVGKIMNADFGMFYALVGEASQVFSTSEVIDTFVYRGLKQTGDIGMASAAGFVQSIISFVLVIFSNTWARKLDKDSAIF
jgi:putative aldouronate transport system permease protein